MALGVMGAEAGTANRSDVRSYSDYEESSPQLGRPNITAIPVKDANFSFI